MRVGLGYDVHRLVEGRRLVLGGVTIPYEKGLLGHSDADVVLHATCDALMGAAALGDIGQHFPDNDPAYEGVASTILLQKTFELIIDKGYRVGNVDATILAEAPKLAPYSAAMEENLSNLLNIDRGSVNVKATTMEGMGAIGRGKAIAALCIVSLFSKTD
jgi:2-C-methyl-D-erythritol 2,4-cyclodiphosphate synthase